MKGNALVLQGEQAKGDKCLRIILGKEKSDDVLRSEIMNNLAVNWWKNSDKTERILPLFTDSL